MVEVTAVFLPAAAKLLIAATPGLPVGVPERSVIDPDILGRHTLRFEKGLEDFVGGPRIDVIGALQHPAPDLLAHQIFDRRDRLLIWRGGGVENVLRALLALILYRIVKQAVELLEYRQHRFARHR